MCKSAKLAFGLLVASAGKLVKPFFTIVNSACNSFLFMVICWELIIAYVKNGCVCGSRALVAAPLYQAHQMAWPLPFSIQPH